MRQHNRSTQSCGSEGSDDDDVSEESEVIKGEDDEMESIRSSHRTSADDMEINDSQFDNQKVKSVDDTQEARDMEGVDFVAVSDLKLSTGAATMEEVAVVAGEEWVTGLGTVIRNLRRIGFAALSEEGYASSIYSLLKVSLAL